MLLVLSRQNGDLACEHGWSAKKKNSATTLCHAAALAAPDAGYPLWPIFTLKTCGLCIVDTKMLEFK